MSILKKLTKPGQGSPLSKANGGDISTPIGATEESTLQYTYSINGIPMQKRADLPQPSQLDLNGKTPSYAYKNTAPIDGLGNI
tara:strand:- start:2220 stop:2468 length:249 start_codon:yes stop_codon:yes gene_type:complete